jgi:hypothetical protein
MYYLIPKGTKIESKRKECNRIGDTDIFVTRKEKLEFIKYAHDSFPIIMDILTQLYPELKNIETSNYCSGYGCYNNLTLGLSIQAIQAIIDNPNIICTGCNVKLPYQKLYYTFQQLTKIIRTEYNGNYCLLIGKSYGQYYIERVLISKVDDQFIPSKPEWVFSTDTTSYSCAVMKSSVYSSGASTVFVEDNLLDDFLNKEYINLETVYIYMHSLEYVKQIHLVRKSFKHVHLLINIKEFSINDYSSIREFAGDTLMIFLNRGSGRFSKAAFREVFMFNSNYLIEKGLIDVYSFEAAGKIINFDTFGVYRSNDYEYYMSNEQVSSTLFCNEAFMKLRKKHNLSVTTEIPNANIYHSDNPYLL